MSNRFALGEVEWREAPTEQVLHGKSAEEEALSSAQLSPKKGAAPIPFHWLEPFREPAFKEFA
jgi:hypothetical protein